MELLIIELFWHSEYPSSNNSFLVSLGFNHILTLKTDPSIQQELAIVPRVPSKSKPTAKGDAIMGKERTMPEELFVPGTVYYLKRNMDCNSNSRIEYFTLWRRHPGDHFPRILLSSNLISDHKCDSHYYALRDVLKASPASTNDDVLFQ